MKEKGLAPVFLDSRLEQPAGWICARYKSSVLLFKPLYTMISKNMNYHHFTYNLIGVKLMMADIS